MVDQRFTALQPRTRMRRGEQLSQPMSYQGQDPMANRTIDPTRTFEVPFVYFPQEILIPPGVSGLSIPLPPRCAQIAFISLVPDVFASFNGGGGRTMKDGFVMNGEFTTLDISTGPAGTCLLQLACY